MSKPAVDIIGQRFGRLVAKGRAGSTANGTPLWEFQCDCGNVIVRQSGSIKSGAAQSCRCLIREITSARSRTHGRSRTKEHRTWMAIHQRCENPNDKGYKRYGGRGITVCEGWADFANFIADMGCAPSPDHSIERVDNNKGYSPDNCIWATPAVQSHNKRSNHLLTFNGQTLNVTQWGDELGLSRDALYVRLALGWSIERALTTPMRPRGPNRRPRSRIAHSRLRRNLG